MTRAETGENIFSDEAEPPSRVQVLLANESGAAVDAGRIEAAVRVALADAAFESAEVSVALVDDAAIHLLNRQYLNHDWPTDVLSFVLEDDGERLEGEIIASAETAERCAAEVGWSAADELMLYVVHGVLHLAGLDDKTPTAAAEMQAAEVRALEKLGVARSATDSRWRGIGGAIAAEAHPLVSESALFWIGAASLLATALGNMGYRALRQFSRHEMGEVCQRRGNPDRFSEILQEHESVALGVEILAAFSAALGIVSGAAWASSRWQFSLGQSAAALFFTALALGLVLVVVRTWAPWAGARLFAEDFLYTTWPVWRLLSMLAMPLAWGARLLDAVLHRLVGRKPQDGEDQAIEEEIRTIVSEGHRGGLLEDEAREMIEGVIDLGDAYVSQIMTPRTEMHMIKVDVPWDEMLADVIQSGHTRIPVYDKTRDDIVGILYSKDLLPELSNAKPDARTPLRKLVRKPLFVPETKAVDDLLQMFQQLRTHIALVLDEYGGVSGLVTIEDVLEEIVGEIDDEYDPESVEEIEVIDEDTCEALGRTHIDEINAAMKLELPEDGDYDTIGGLVFSELGRVPAPGETVEWQDKVRIIVLEATKRRIDRVRIQRIERGQRESA